MLACMIDQLDWRCPDTELGETTLPGTGLETSDGKRRPRGALLQSVVVVKARSYSVDRRRRRIGASQFGVNNVTLSYLSLIANPSQGGDSYRWAVWLGRHSLEKVSRDLKVRLIPVRNREKSANAKAGLTGLPISVVSSCESMS